MAMRFRMWLPGCSATVFLVFFPLLASASQVFVDAAIGNDEVGNGSAVKPWRSIQKALEDQSDSEVTVWIGPGVYRESIAPPAFVQTLRLSGPGAPYANIDATAIPDEDAALVLSEGQTVWVEGLTLVGGGQTVPTSGKAVRRNGADVHLVGCVTSYVRWWRESQQPQEELRTVAPNLLLEGEKAIPEPGFFAGFNSQNRPITFVVASTSRELRSFRYALRVPCSQCTLNTSVSTEWFTDAPQIVNGAFSFTVTLGGADWRFTGAFNSPKSVNGRWYAPDWDSSCGSCGAQGTWSAVRELFQPDVNHDDIVNAIDIQLVINEALSLLPAAGGDINGDGEANAIDIQLVVNAVLGMVIR
jgi:hypothetical protein